MTRSKRDLIDAIDGIIAAQQIAGNVVSLAANLAEAKDDGTGVYADAARYDLGRIDAALVTVRSALNRMPAVNQGEAA